MNLKITGICFILIPHLLCGQEERSGLGGLSILNDTIRLEDVSISVMPFRETFLEATGGLYLLNTAGVDLGQEITMTEQINLAPGIYMAEGTYTTSRLVIRGVGSRTPYNSNRIRAYLDDIPLTTGDGISTVEDLDPSSVGLLEVVKGPSSALYGSGLGGVVRLNSPYPAEDGFRGTLSGEVGSFGTIRLGAGAGYKNERLALQGGVSRSIAEGYRENNRYRRNNIFLNVRYFGRKNTLSLTLSVVDLFAQIPSSLNETDFETKPWKAAESWKNIEGYEEYIKLLAGMKLESELSSRLVNHLVLFSSYSDPYESRPFNILDDRSVSTGFREYLELDLEQVRLSAGMEYFHEWYRWQIYETLQGSRGNLQSDQKEVRKYFNGFALVQWRPVPRIVIDGGINLNLLRYGLETSYRIDSTDQSGTYRYDPVISPRVGISYRYHTLHYLYASSGHGFSAPSLEETLLPEGEINTDLRPETGWNLEAGSRGSLRDHRLTYDITLYTIFLNDLLVTERLAEDIFTGANAGKARNSGLELSVRYMLNPDDGSVSRNAGLGLGYTISRNMFTSFVDDEIDYSGNMLPGIPVQRLNAVLQGKVSPFHFQLHSQFTGSQWMDDTNLNKYSGYYLLHLRVTWKHVFKSFPLGMEVYAGIRNALNTHYASMILVNAPSFGGSLPRYYYPGLPRYFYMGVRLNLTDRNATE